MYHISLRFYLSVDFFLGLCLGSWRYHYSESWGACVILNEGFSIGPGVSIRILALVVLTILFWPVQAVPSKGSCQRLFAGNTKGDFIISQLSPPCTVCRQLGWPFCQDWISCCHFDQHCSCNNSGCWASCPVAVWVLSLKGVRKIDLWNWLLKSRLCLEFLQ